MKIYDGIYATLDQMNIECKVTGIAPEEVRSWTSTIEAGSTEIRDAQLSPPKLFTDIEFVLQRTDRKRCVLLLDDAAHAFSSEQQRDFFEMFRQLKSRNVSPKAAVYPGVTVYSPNFHVGHDAEEVDIWLNPYKNDYQDFMHRLLERRFPAQAIQSLLASDDAFRLLAICAFGVPRLFLNMLRELLPTEISNTSTKNFSRQPVLDAIKACSEGSFAIFESLKHQLPFYSKFIEAGSDIYTKMIESLRIYNVDKGVEQQGVTIAIKDPIPPEIDRVLGFFQYAGLLMKESSIRRGRSAAYSRFLMHPAALVTANAIVGKSSVSTGDYALALSSRSASAITRVSPQNLLGGASVEDVLPLSLPPCQTCNAVRISVDAKFCMNCGAKLKPQSAFGAIVSQSIDVLKLTPGRLSAIREQSTIRTIKDILMDHDHRQLRNVRGVGDYWADRIYRQAEELLG